MRDLRVYLDSKLKSLNLFSSAQKIVSSFSLLKDEKGNLKLEEEFPNKKFALDVYAGFVELAKLSDEYRSWGEAEWNNFVTMMNLAFKEKGRGLALTNALCAISGIVLSSPVDIIDTDEGTHVVTHVKFEIEQLSTPFTSRFKDLVKQLLPKLYWVHNVSLEPPEGASDLFKNITVKVDDSVTYEKNLYANPKFFCENDSTITGLIHESWGID